jgi:hypothetical protein
MNMMEVCFTCGKEYFSLATPMRCAECVKNKVPVQTSPVRDCFWVLTTEPCQADEKINSEIQ